MTKKFSIGIDLGTTNSSICYYDEVKEESILIEMGDNKLYIPSYVNFESFTEEDPVVMVGLSARNSINSNFLPSIVYDTRIDFTFSLMFKGILFHFFFI